MKYFAVCVLLLGIAVSAQTPEPIVSYDLLLFTAAQNPATDAPLEVKAVPLSAVTCGLPRLGAQPDPNFVPHVVRWDDPANTALQCETVPSAFFQTVGTGFRVVLVAKGATTTSPRSAASNPFAVAAVAPAKPTGVLVR